MPRTKLPAGQSKTSRGVAVQPVLEQEIEAIASKEERTWSKVAEMLMKRGLAAYRRDGRLDEPIPTVDETDVTKAEVRELKPVAVEMPTRRRKVG